MRKVGDFPSRHAAERFHWYLLAENIENQLDQTPHGWEIWIHDDDHLDTARKELDSYLESPESDKYQVSPPEPVKQKQVKQPRRLTGTPGIPLTRLIIASCTLLTIVTVLGKFLPNIVDDLAFSRVILKKEDWPWPISPEIAHGEFWRLLTPMLLHLSPLHLIFNMYWFWILGGNLESRHGSTRLAILIIITGAGSHITEYYLFGPAFFGISGVVYGLLGYYWMKSMVAPEVGFYIPENIIILMLLWLFLGVSGMLKAMGMPVANGAHFGGLVVGMALAFVRGLR